MSSIRCSIIFRELKQTSSIKAYVKKFTTLIFQIPNLTYKSMMFHFMDNLQNWARTELERRRLTTIDEAITKAEALIDFKHNLSKGKEAKSSHENGGGDPDKIKEKHPSKSHDRSENKKFGR